MHAPDVGALDQLAALGAVVPGAGPLTARLRLLPDAGQVVGLGEDAHLELGIKDFVNRVLINVPSTLIIDSLLLTWMYLERS